MSKEIRRLSRRKKVLKEIERIIDNSQDALIIHYSCESFYDRDDGKTPRVTSIAVRNLKFASCIPYPMNLIVVQ